MADSDGDTFTDPAWAGLGVHKARAVVPYDVAQTDPADTTAAGDRRREFDEWVRGAADAGVEPLVAFSASRHPTKLSSTGQPTAPTRAEFAAAMRAFLSQYPSVRRLAAWNEPNFRASSNPLASEPTLAAQLHLELGAVCREQAAGCTVAAGDFAGIPGDDSYVDAYQAALGDERPEVWAFHAHTDANRFQQGTDSSAPATRYYLSKLGGAWAGSRIWIDEIGAYYRDASAKVWGDASQRDTASFILGLARLSDRIDRIYYYNHSNECSTASHCAVQDRGLVAPSPWDGSALSYDEAGRVRGAYEVIRDGAPVIAPTVSPAVPPVPPDDRPSVSAVNPEDTATDVPVSTNVVVRFSEPMNRSSAQAAFGLRKAGSTTKLGGSFSWSSDGTTMTFNPTYNLAGKGVRYDVSVTNAAKDLVGNAMGAGFGAYFTTDARAPTVDRVEPADGATGVPVTTNPPPPPSPPPLDLTMTRSDIRSYIRGMIRRRTNGRVRKLRSRCRRLSYRSVRCRLGWRIGRYRYAGTARLWHSTSSGRVRWHYRFKGQRRKIGCRRSRRCVRRAVWRSRA